MYLKLYFFISENSLEIFWISQLISRGTCHGHVTGHTTNEFLMNKWIFIWIFTCENADIPYICLSGVSLVLHLIHKWNFFFGTEGYLYVCRYVCVFFLYSFFTLFLLLTITHLEKQLGVNCIRCAVRPQSCASHNRGSLHVQASPLALSYPEFSH